MLKKVCTERGTLTNGWVPLDPADMDFIEAVYKKNIREGEERLMLAVLESAVEDFQKYVLARHARGKKLFQEAEEWLLDKDSEEVFSFQGICETLRLHPEPIRKGLMIWKEARLKTPSVEVIVKDALGHAPSVSGTLRSDFPRRHKFFPCRNCNPTLHLEH
jgi:hypothetical protein